METLGIPFAHLTEFVFTNVNNAGWAAYQPVAGLISFIILLAFLAAYVIYYYLLKSTDFGTKSWIGIGLLAALSSGYFAYSQVYDLGVTQNRLTINPQPQNVYDVLVDKARMVALMAFISCLTLYVVLSLVWPIRRHSRHADIPFTPRKKR